MTTGRDEAIRAAAARHGLGEGAVAALWDALVRGGGRQAQFSHPELGGMGQWSGGMGQIGDMWNADLKARVVGACADLATALAGERQAASAPSRGSVPQTGPRRTSGEAALAAGPTPRQGRSEEWPPGLGRPSASGAQDGIRYAVFPDSRRLAIERGGRVTLYDTGDHRIGGVSQAQSSGRHLAFTSQHGTIDPDSLPEVED